LKSCSAIASAAQKSGSRSAWDIMLPCQPYHGLVSREKFVVGSWQLLQVFGGFCGRPRPIADACAGCVPGCWISGGTVEEASAATTAAARSDAVARTMTDRRLSSIAPPCVALR
jgi:hypothetical protein